MRILIAEDDVTSRTMLKAVLTQWGYDVLTTADGAEAWEAFQDAGAPQMAILDWMMPEIDGPTLCGKLRAQQRPTPLYLILLTAKGESRDIVRGLEAGADDYIAKPYDVEELRVRCEVGRRILRLQSELREKEKFRGVLEMAGAVCHELNQPLQMVMGYAEILMMDLPENHPQYPVFFNIKSGVDRIGGLTRKIMNISRYRTKDYLDSGSRIIDIDQSSRHVWQ